MSFSCDTITDPEIRGKLDRIAKHVHTLARPLVCLPNIHPKKGLESPPQFVAVTKDIIIPQLTAPAMNCGMSVWKTDLTEKDFSLDMLTAFAEKLRAGVPARRTRMQMLLEWIGISKREETPYDLSRKELEELFLHGAPAALKKYGLPAEEAARMEYGGCVLREQAKQAVNLAELVPRSSYANGRHEMGYNFGGNHFLELHTVEEVKDEKQAGMWGIHKGQILIFYHGGGGHATYHLGRYFGHREKNTHFEKCVLFVLKLFFHFGSWEGLRRFSLRWRAYFSHTPFPATPTDSPEGRRLMQSIQIGLNYGYGFRVALLKRLRDSLPAHANVSFVWDAAHNSIIEEVHNNEHFIVHRQDAVRVFENKPIMIAGWNTLSYLGVGTPHAEASYYSATPSAGKTIGRYVKENKSSPDPAHTTLQSKRKEKKLTTLPHTTSEGLFDVVKVFEEEHIMEPVAYLRPLGALKGH